MGLFGCLCRWGTHRIFMMQKHVLFQEQDKRYLPPTSVSSCIVSEKSPSPALLNAFTRKLYPLHASKPSIVTLRIDVFPSETVPPSSVSLYMKSFGPPLYPHGTLSHWKVNDVSVLLVEMTFAGGAEGAG